MRFLFQRLLSLLLTGTLVFASAPPALATVYDGHPKLIVIVVIDQFREDYLERYRADLKAARGFRLFLDHGAYFPDCYYDYANTKTAPGHATIGTGAYTDGHGIASNEWWDLDRSKDHAVTSVEDERYHTVGLVKAPEGRVGASPLNELASTLGDEMRLATGGQSRVYGVSLKDRAAILPAGHTANGAFWIDADSGNFISSTFYMNALPAWATEFNAGSRAQQALDEAGATKAGNFYEQVGATPAGNTYELDFARALITGEQLGHHPTTDLLTISLSANDILGHRVGPDAPQERQMVDALDAELDGFFSWLDTHVDGGLNNVWVALSADHGVAPLPSEAAALGLPAANLDMLRLTSALNDAMNGKFSPGEKLEYLMPHQELPYIALNRPAFERAGINEQEAEDAVQAAIPGAMASLPAQPPIQPIMVTPPAALPGASKGVTGKRGRSTTVRRTPPARARKGAAGAKAAPAAVAAPAEPQPLQPPSSKLPPRPLVVHTFTREILAAGSLPPNEFGTLIAHSYSANGGWWVMVLPESFQMGGVAQGTTHFSPWSYDRHVPMGFFGAPFAPGIYHGRVGPVDIAATLASLLGINQPSASVGTILTRALRTAPETTAKGGRKGRAAGKAAENPAGETPATASPAPATAVPSGTPPASVNPAPEIPAAKPGESAPTSEPAPPASQSPANRPAPETAPPDNTPAPPPASQPTSPPPANAPANPPANSPGANPPGKGAATR